MTSTWDLTNGDGYNVYVTTMVAGVDDDTEVLFINPTSRDISVFIKNPNKETIQFRGTNIFKDDIVMADFICLVPDIKSIEYSNGFITTVTAIVFDVPSSPVGTDIKISILERLR